MTFKLKELIELKAHLERTIDIMLKHNNKDTIEELHEPRRSELLILATALKDAEAQISERPAKASGSASSKITPPTIQEKYLSAYYGLMLAAREHTGDLNGKLAKRIADATDIKAENKPEEQDLANFHTAANVYLQRKLFTNSDSRNGIKKDHVFTAVAPEKLKELLEISYKLDNDAQIAVITSLAVTEKSPAVKAYAKQTPESALAIFPSWAKLLEALDTLIAHELADKNVATINELDRARAAQLYSLEALAKQLKTTSIDEKEKIAVLAGTMHLVHQQIKLEYKYSKPENSLIYNELGKLLHIKTAKSQDIEALLHAANQYIRYTTIAQLSSEPQVIKAIRSKHLFASIEHFDLKAVLTLFQNMIYDSRVVASKLVFEALVHTAEAEKVLAQEPEASKSWIPSLPSLPSLGGMFSASAKKAEAVVHEPVSAETAAASSTSLAQ